MDYDEYYLPIPRDLNIDNWLETRDENREDLENEFENDDENKEQNIYDQLNERSKNIIYGPLGKIILNRRGNNNFCK